MGWDEDQHAGYPEPMRLAWLLAVVGCTHSPSLLMQASLSARIEIPVSAPPPPKPAVALQGAEVVEFFGVPLDDADEVVFVLDVSGSMLDRATGVLATLPASKNAAQSASPGAPAPTPQAASPSAPAPAPTKMEVARTELLAAIERLPDTTRINVIFFGTSLLAYAPSTVRLGPERQRIVQFIEGARAYGATALAPALRVAFLRNVPRIVLLSDGFGNQEGSSYDVLRDAREAMRGGVRIDTIGIGGHDAALMRALATESGGLYQSL